MRFHESVGIQRVSWGLVNLFLYYLFFLVVGELKTMLSLITSLEPREQRVLFKGKERDDCEYLHMVGVTDKDKVLLLEDPAIKERKRLLGQAIGTPYHTISV